MSFILLQPQGILVREQQGIFLPTSFEACSPAPCSPEKKAVYLKDNLWSVSFVSCSCPKRSRLAVSQLLQPEEPHLSKLIKGTGQKHPKAE